MKHQQMLVVMVAVGCAMIDLVTATMAFQVSTSPSRTDVTHEFWRKERSRIEVESHVYSCLTTVEERRSEFSMYKPDESLQPRVHVISAEPPLVIIHDFLSANMCQEIIEKACDSGRMERSKLGETQATSDVRTSSTVWLQDVECPDPLRLIAEKVSSISGLPPGFMENLQVVRYRPGQQFSLHTDHKDSFNELACRGRLATCLIYLSEPTAGGETWFPGVFPAEASREVVVPPKVGSAVFFWNTVEKPGAVDYEPEMFLNVDNRMRHAGLPVERGEKWICNRWIHPVDFGAGVRGL